MGTIQSTLERWRTGIRLSETAVVIGLWAGALAIGDVVIAQVLFVAGLLVGFIAILADPNGTRRSSGQLIALLGVFFLGAEGLFLWRHQVALPVAPKTVTLTREIDRYFPMQPGTAPKPAPNPVANVLPEARAVKLIRKSPILGDPLADGYTGALTPLSCTNKVRMLTNLQIKLCINNLVERLGAFNRASKSAQSASISSSSFDVINSYEQMRSDFSINYKQECLALEKEIRSRLGISGEPRRHATSVATYDTRSEGRNSLATGFIGGPDPIGEIIDYISDLSAQLPD